MTMPAPKPVLKPALRLLRRDPTTLQLGAGPRGALLLTNVDDGDICLLALLDGSRDAATALREAAALGVDPVRATALLGLLRHADALDEAPGDGGPGVPARLLPDALALSLRYPGAGAARLALARRAATGVDVYGGGRVGAAVAGLLAAAGIGDVAVIDRGPVRPADLGPAGIRRVRSGSRGEAATRPPAAAGRAREERPPARRIAVIAPVGAAAAPEVLAALRSRVHLSVAVRQDVGVVGPLVVPGRTPCLRCLELARGERDPGWPRLAAQLVGESARKPQPCDVVLATLTAATAAAQLLAYVDGLTTPATLGGVLDIDGATGKVRRRSVSSHSACGCSTSAAPDTMDG